MSLLDSVLNKLGLQRTQAAKTSTPTFSESGPSQTAQAAAAAQAAANKPIQVVDVVSKLEGMAKRYPMKLNWKESIVDLLVLLDLPHGADDLTRFATELNCPANIVNDSFKRNMWLHKTVLQQIADCGGNIPVSLLK